MDGIRRPLPASDGATLGDFAVVGFLGRGGAGEVCRAEYILPKTPVALKVLHRGDDAGKARFAPHNGYIFVGRSVLGATASHESAEGR